MGSFKAMHLFDALGFGVGRLMPFGSNAEDEVVASGEPPHDNKE